MTTDREEKKKKIKRSPNLWALSINTREAHKNDPLEGVATQSEEMVEELVTSPRKFYKKGVPLDEPQYKNGDPQYGGKKR